MKKLIVATVILLLQVSAAYAQNTQSGNATNGKAVFMRVGCYACHGTVGQGGTGPHLAPPRLNANGFMNFVRKPQGMPPYSEKVLTNQELTDILAYLATIPAPPAVASIPLLNQ